MLLSLRRCCVCDRSDYSSSLTLSFSDFQQDDWKNYACVVQNQHNRTFVVSQLNIIVIRTYTQLMYSHPLGDRIKCWSSTCPSVCVSVTRQLERYANPEYSAPLSVRYSVTTDGVIAEVWQLLQHCRHRRSACHRRTGVNAGCEPQQVSCVEQEEYRSKLGPTPAALQTG